MSKIAFNVPTLRRNVCSMRDVQYNFEQLAAFFDLIDAPAKPRTDEEADELPSVDPSRAWVRFQLTSTFDGGTNIAPAKVIDSGGSDLVPGETVPGGIYDGIGRYVADADGTEVGYAQQFEQPDGSLAWEPVSLGGLGGASGTDTYQVKFDAADDAEFMQHKFDDLQVSDTYDALTHHLVLSAVIGSGTDRTLRLYVVKDSAAETFKVKVTTDDLTEEFLHASMNDPAAVAYDPDLHSLVEFLTIGAPGANQKLRGFVHKDQESGKVRVTAADVLDYLFEKWEDFGPDIPLAYDANLHDLTIFQFGTNPNKLRAFVAPRVACKAGDKAEYLSAQFVDLTATAFDSNAHTAVKFVEEESAGDTDLRAYIPNSAIDDLAASVKVAKLTTTVPARSGGTWGSVSASIGTSTDGAYVHEENATVYNTARREVYVYDEVYMPIGKVGGDWLLLGTLQLETLTDWNPNLSMYIQQCEDMAWIDGAPVLDLRVEVQIDNTMNLDFFTFCDGWTTFASTKEC